MKISEIASLLGNVTICHNNEDGRVNSIKDEETLIDQIKDLGAKHGFKVEIPRSREWYDVKISGLPVQIKSSTGGTDNWSSKKSLLWALSTLDMSEVTDVKDNHRTLQKELVACKDIRRPLPRNMDILCIDKGNGKVYHKTLCDLLKLTSNGNNLPFQINWKNEWKDLKLRQRSQKEAFDFILGAYTASVKKKREQDDYELLVECLEQ